MYSDGIWFTNERPAFLIWADMHSPWTSLRSGMVWVVEKKIVHHILDMDYEQVEIPVRIKFEFEVMEGILVPNILSKETLYNRTAIEHRLSQQV